MAQMQILVGSETGTARRTALYIQTELKDQSHSVLLNEKTTCADIVRNKDEVILICTSSTGAGELPTNIHPLFTEMHNTPPRIANKRYGLISLGDSSFATFGEAGTALDELFTDYGAVRVGDLLQIDGMETFEPEEIASKWAIEWASSL